MVTLPSRQPPHAVITAAVQRILDRRRRVGDQDLYLASDDPLQLVGYVIAHRRVSAEILELDLQDVLVILAHIGRVVDQYRLSAFRMARDRNHGLGLTLARIAKLVGANSPQAMWGEIKRLEYAVEYGGAKDERAAAQQRRHPRVRASALDAQAEQFRALADALLRERPRLEQVCDLSYVEEELEALSTAEVSITDDLLVYLAAAIRELHWELPRDDPLWPQLDWARELFSKRV